MKIRLIKMDGIPVHPIKAMVLLLLATCLFSACKKGSSTDGGNKNEPAVELSKLQITSIGDLNKGTAEINSHADVISCSSLKMDYRSLVGLGKADLGVDNPRYPRIKKMANGGYIIFYHSTPGTVGTSCDYAISNDLKRWIPRGKIFEPFAITDSNGGANKRAVTR
jgi:hypothetical protein